MQKTEPRLFDCAIIGGGPSGLTAAIYLARFLLRVVVIDEGRGRAVMIPRTHNHAGFPDGVNGADLVRRMHEQAERYGTEFKPGKAISLQRGKTHFEIAVQDDVIEARTVLLATGVSNRRHPVLEPIHDMALERGLLRYCPVCDGYEVTDQRVAVIGTGDHGLREAEFLRSYTADVTLIAPDAAHQLDAAQIDRAGKWGIKLSDGPCTDIKMADRELHVTIGSKILSLDSVYVGLGSDIHSTLAREAGAATSPDGCILVDSHQATNVENLFAAGDVVLGLDQISNAMGQAGVAATAIRNKLCAETPLRR